MTISQADLARMQTTQDDSMQDTCVIYSYSGGALDGYGRPTDPYSEGVTTPCGFAPYNKGEAMGHGQVALTDAVLRLPLLLYETLTTLTRIKLTKRYGVDVVEPEFFDFDGEPEEGPSAVVVNLKRVTDGTDPN